MCTRAVEFRATAVADGGDGRTLSGYATVYGQKTEINSWEGIFTEQFTRGAFKKTLSESKNLPVMQFNHGRDSGIGAVPIGKYETMREDDEGLFVEGRLFDNALVEPVRQAIEAQAITGMSIRFQVVRDEWRDGMGKLIKPDELSQLLYNPGDRGPLVRTIKEAKLAEAGPVVFPAYEGTSVGVRMTESDRAALELEYRRTMADDSEPEVDMRTSEKSGPETAYLLEDLNRWLAAETAHRSDTASWLAAETVWRTGQTKDFEDRRRRLRGHLAESRTPDKTDAAPDKGTSEDRDTKKPNESRKAGNLMNIHELKARAAEITTRLTELDTEHRDSDLPDEVRAEWDEAETELGEVETKIKAIEDRTENMRKLAAKTPTKIEKGSAPAVTRDHTDDDIFNLEELRSNSYGGEDFLRKVDDNARRAIDTMTYGSRYREGAQGVITRLLEEVDTPSRDLAKRILLTGSPEYLSGFSKVLRHGSDAFCTQEERQALLRAQTLVPDSGGGYAVPVQLDPTLILTNAGVRNPIRSVARVEQIVGKIWQGVTTTGTSVTRGAEGATSPDSSFATAQPTLTTNKVQGFVPFSIEIELSWDALMSSITKLLVDAKAVEENSFITGDGTGTNPGGIIGTLPGGQNVATAAVGTFTYPDVYSLQTALPPRWEDGATIMAHKGILNKVRQFDTAGGAQFWGSLANGNPNTILDYQVVKASAMDSTVATGKKIMLYGDFDEFLIVDRIGMNIELVPHVFDPAAANRPTGQRGVYAVWMNNSKILVPSAFQLLTVA